MSESQFGPTKCEVVKSLSRPGMLLVKGTLWNGDCRFYGYFPGRSQRLAERRAAQVAVSSNQKRKYRGRRVA